MVTRSLGENSPEARSIAIYATYAIAPRIVAAPSTKDYGALSIWIQSQCQVRIVRVLPPSVFWPKPKVSSAIVQITVDDARRRRIPDRTYWHQFVRAMFFHRRKFLRSVALAAFKKELSKQQLDAVLASLELGKEARAEQLDVSTMLALCEAIRAKAPQWHL